MPRAWTRWRRAERNLAALAAIETPRLTIMPFGPRHLTGRYIAWLNDPAVVRFSELRHRRHDRASCEAYFEAIARSDGFFCAIEEKSGGRHVGNLSVAVDGRNGLADISILIGERSVWGQGVGLEAWSAVLHALLDREGFRKVTGGTVAPNRAMVRIMEKSGMRPDGRRAAHYLIEGEPVDVVHYAALSGTRAAT